MKTVLFDLLFYTVDEWRGKWLLEKKWQMKTIAELKEGMKSINDHVRLAAVSAAGKVIVGMRDGETVSYTHLTLPTIRLV